MARSANAQIDSPTYDKFDGGLNIRDFWHTIADNELTLANNIRLDEGGVVRRRGGWTKLASAAAGSAGNLIGVVQGSWLIAGVLTRYVVVTDGTKVFWLNGVSWTDITGGVVMSPGSTTLVSFVQFNNLLIGFDGTNAPWTWDGAAGSISVLAGTPPVGNMGIVWQNRYFIAGVGTARTRLYYSEIGDPTVWGASAYVDVPSPYDGDEITGLAILYGNLIVFKRHSVYIIQGDSPSNFVVSKTNAAVGCVSPYSVISVDNLVYFVSDKGLYALNLSNTKQICYKVEPRYNSAVTNQLASGLTKNRIQAAHYRYRNEIWMMVDASAAGQDTHDRTIVHNYNVVDKNGDPAVSEHYKVAGEVASYTVTLNTNDFIDFNDGGFRSAQLTAGTYIMGSSSAVAGSLCALIKTKMDAAGVGATYTVTFNSATRRLTIARSAGSFAFNFFTGANFAKSAYALMGFTQADTAVATSATSDSQTAAPVTIGTAPAVVADYIGSAGITIPIASFYDKYVYIFTEGITTDAAPLGVATNIALQFTTGYKDFGDNNATKTLRNIWTSISFAAGTPLVSIGVLSSDFAVETVATLTPASPSTFYNTKQPCGQIFGSSPQGKYFKFGFTSSDGGTFSFFQVSFDVVWNGRRA